MFIEDPLPVRVLLLRPAHPARGADHGDQREQPVEDQPDGGRGPARQVAVPGHLRGEERAVHQVRRRRDKAGRDLQAEGAPGGVP